MRQPSMCCPDVQASFSGYLDGAIPGRQMQQVAEHLEDCADCRRQFAQWRGLQAALAQAGSVKAPVDLGLRLRLAISHENARRQEHWWDRLLPRWENLLRPALLQASAGLVGTVLLLGSIGMLLGAVAAPDAVLANDEPLGAMTSPHLRYSASSLPPVATASDTTLVVEAKINSAGRVYDFEILSGPQDAAVLAQVRDHLMVQVYEPARVFGEPIRGRVLITFAGVSVHA